MSFPRKLEKLRYKKVRNAEEVQYKTGNIVSGLGKEKRESESQRGGERKR